MTKFLLDSGDPDEYREIADLAKKNNSELWGATTNPSLIAKKLAGKKFTTAEAFDLQKKIVSEILTIVPGAVSAEVYADETTTAEQMIEQGKDIATWSDRIYVKLPTNLEGFKARTTLRKEKIAINNTLVFSQEQIFAICLHEKLVQKEFGLIENKWPTFISPFVGRLDDIGVNGMDLIREGIRIKSLVAAKLWMLESSVRTSHHIKEGIDIGTEIMTAPVKVYREWFDKNSAQPIQEYQKPLQTIPKWQPSEELLAIDSLNGFMDAIITEKLNIHHELTDKGIIRFTQDWKAIIT